MRQLVRNMQQVNDCMYTNIKSNSSEYYSCRDEYMAENATWLSTLLGENTKIALWAHNGHVSSGMWVGGVLSMGNHLRREFGDQYQIVGFSFSKGSFMAITQTSSGGFRGLDIQTIESDPPTGTLNNLFFNAQHDNFILRVADIPTDSELGNWISDPRILLIIGAAFNGNPSTYYYYVILRSYYDVMINVDMTSASVQL